MPGAHAKLSPSAAYIWLRCAGMPVLAEGIPEGESNEYAKDGTRAHRVLELALNSGNDAKFYTRPEVQAANPELAGFDADGAEAVQLALDYIRREVEDGDETATETRLTYSADLWGTCDFDRYRPTTRELLVVDYKHGSGVPVEAKGNPQGVIYALMRAKALGNRGISRVRFVILQPRCFHEDGPIREYEIEAADFLDWESDIQSAVERVQEAGRVYAGAHDMAAWAADFVQAGDHCRWCKAAGVCPALAAEKDRALQAAFDEPVAGTVPSADTIDVARLADALRSRAKVKAWLEAVDALAYSLAVHGTEIPGFKLVRKKAVRKVRDEAAVLAAVATEFLGDVPEAELYVPAKLKTPFQLETALEPFMSGKTKKARIAVAKEFLADYVSAESSGTVLVPEEDERPAVRGDVNDAFAEPVE